MVFKDLHPWFQKGSRQQRQKSQHYELHQMTTETKSSRVTHTRVLWLEHGCSAGHSFLHALHTPSPPKNTESVMFVTFLFDRNLLRKKRRQRWVHERDGSYGPPRCRPVAVFTRGTIASGYKSYCVVSLGLFTFVVEQSDHSSFAVSICQEEGCMRIPQKKPWFIEPQPF
jgi:hypothetical protein